MQRKGSTPDKKKITIGIIVTIGLLSILIFQSKSWTKTRIQTFVDTINLKVQKTVSTSTTTVNGSTKIHKRNMLTVYPPTKFNINKSDVFIQIHIQKTGGSYFELRLVYDLKSLKCTKLPGRKNHHCVRPNSDSDLWLFSRRSAGWDCGLHPDYTTITQCVDGTSDGIKKTYNSSQRYFYLTFLRNPLNRYISEWFHVRRGATWSKTKYVCNEQQYHMPLCYSGKNWSNATLDEFLNCPFNMASNRQTRMLADLRLVKCYEMFTRKKFSANDRDALQKKMLYSAKQNLKAMAFFGLEERMKESQYLFEYKFGLRFRSHFNQSNDTFASSYQPNRKEMKRIYENNKLDMKLYKFARKLFAERLLIARS